MGISSQDVIAVLVTYQPDEAVAARIEQHLTQFQHVIVIDNGAETPAECLPNHEGVTLRAHAVNNLAAAQNEGIRLAKSRGAKAVLLLDDDSELSAGGLAALCAAYAAGDGLVAPQLLENGQPTKQVVPWFGVLFRRTAAPIEGSFTPIASGSLIPLDVLEQVGLMDESFVIDYIDRDFCLRLLQRGYRTKVIVEAQLHHRLGASRSHAFGMVSRNHSAARRRSIFCNRLRCWGRYGLSVPSFLLYDVLAAGYDIARIILFEQDKRAKLMAVVSGMADAIFTRR